MDTQITPFELDDEAIPLIVRIEDREVTWTHETGFVTAYPEIQRFLEQVPRRRKCRVEVFADVFYDISDPAPKGPLAALAYTAAAFDTFLFVKEAPPGIMSDQFKGLARSGVYIEPEEDQP